MRVPACLIAVPLLAGTAAGVLIPVASGNEVSACAAGAVLCLLAGALLYADGEPAGVALCVIAGAALAGTSMGMSSVRRLTSPPLLGWFEALPADDAVPVRVEGRLRDDAAVVEYGVLLTLDVDCAAIGRSPCARVRGGVRLVVAGDAAAASAGGWRAGRRIRAPALMRRPAWFANPGVPDERRALALRGVVLTAPSRARPSSSQRARVAGGLKRRPRRAPALAPPCDAMSRRSTRGPRRSRSRS